MYWRVWSKVCKDCLRLMRTTWSFKKQNRILQDLFNSSAGTRLCLWICCHNTISLLLHFYWILNCFLSLPSQMFPYSLLAMAVLMYLPALIWRLLVSPTLGSDLLFIIDELDKSYNRSVRLAQNILEMRQNTKNPLTFQAELQRWEIFEGVDGSNSCSPILTFYICMYINA